MIRYQKHLSLWIIAMFATVLWGARPAAAVVKNVNVDLPTGEIVASTSIKIFNDQNEQVGEEKTDENGVLIFDFPKQGNYMLRFTARDPQTGEEKEYEKKVGIVWWGLTHTLIAAGTVVVAGGVGLGVGLTSGGHNNLDDTGGDTGDGTGDDTGGDTGDDLSRLDGRYTVTGFSSTGPHGPHIMLTLTHLIVETEPFTINSGDANFVPVVGSINSSDLVFDATGVGVVASTPGVGVSFGGSFTENGNITLNGTYVMGTGSELPGGLPQIYAIEATKD